VTPAEVARVEDRLRQAYDDAAKTLGDDLFALRMRPSRRSARRIWEQRFARLAMLDACAAAVTLVTASVLLVPRVLHALAGNAAAREPRPAWVRPPGWTGAGMQPRYLMAEGVVGQLQARMR
jgi:hypothetical protein